MCKNVNFCGLTAVAILILWISFIGVLGSSLFEEVYKSNSPILTIPLVVYAFILGCGSLVLFMVSRGFQGLRIVQKTHVVPTRNSLLCYVAHTMLCFLCVVTTSLAFANLRAAAGGGDLYRPPVSVLLIVFSVNTLNGFLSIEQVPRASEKPLEIQEEIERLVNSDDMFRDNVTYKTVAVQPKTD